ncbi:hypothetical protein [Streptomyces sp. NPDC051183]|uniref:hypothetical protein n=1 Tax=Streptomyces sp. NPDC051183 TaxID=3155165 RepID=UPI003424E8AC
MERLLKADGDSVDALVEVHAADLAPNGHTHLLIAREQAAADGYADQRQWLALADRIRDGQPAEALGVYLRWIEPLRGQTGDRTYERLVELLLSARACHRTLGTEAEFDTYVAALRADQKRKRKLMAVLDQHGL